jgi:hypothetical protein
MESYKIKQSFLGLLQAYFTPFLTIGIIVFFLISYSERHSTFMLFYIVILIAVIGYRYYMYVNRPMEIEVDGDRIKFKTIFGKITELSFADIQDIEVTRRKELLFSLKDKKIRGLNTYKDFDKFIADAKQKNPAIKFWGFSK